MSEQLELAKSLYFFSLQGSERERRDRLRQAMRRGAIRREAVLEEFLIVNAALEGAPTPNEEAQATLSLPRRIRTVGISADRTESYLRDYHRYLFLTLNPTKEELEAYGVAHVRNSTQDI